MRNMPQNENSLNAAIALTRFGMGARPGEIDRVAANPREWLEAQVRASGAPVPRGEFPSSTDQVQALLAYRQDIPDRPTSRREAGAGPEAAMNTPTAVEGNRLHIDFDKAGSKKVIDSFVKPA